MRKIIIFLYFLVVFYSTAFALESCFLVKKNDKILIKEGECNISYGPQSTFKIALSLIGFDSSILKDENHPSWELLDQTNPYINVCKGKHDPHGWMRDSCVWYSQILTTKIGIEKLQNYIDKFSYGNMDLSGGVKNFWLSNSLKISPEEQISFLQKIINRELPVSNYSYDKTKNIMFIQEMAGGWKLYGKTGNGNQVNKEGNQTELQQGWFVGYIEKDGHQITFVNHIVDNEKQTIYASFRAKNETLTKLWYLIQDLEK